MKVTSNQIELWAVGKVEEVFTRSNRFIPRIPRGDKDPAWDGCIYLLSEDKSTKRIPVQVKGKTRKSLPNKPSYPVSVLNLKNYLRDGGILYCVVFIVEDKKFLYYAKLAPVDLKRFIKAANGQATISIPLRKFDKDVAEMELEMQDFCNDCKRQTSFVDAPTLSIDDAIKQGHKINFQVSGTQKKNGGYSFFEEPVYLYAEIQKGDTKMYYPLGDQAYMVMAGPHVKEDVIANGHTYFNEYVVLGFGDERQYIVNDILNIQYRRIDGMVQPSTTKIHSNAKMLSSKIHELHFILDMFTSHQVKLGQNLFKFNDVTESQINEVSEELNYWNRTRELFDKLHITEDIEIGKFSKLDKDNLSMLMGAILDSKPISDPNEIDVVAHIHIGKYKIFLLVEKNEDNTYTISDFFDGADRMCFAYEEGNEQRLMTSMFTVFFNNPGFEYFANVDYSKMLPSYEEALRYNPFLCARANNDMLMALKAYDSMPEKDDKLYNAILSLNDWITERSSKDETIHVVNKYQILKRKRDLTKDEKKVLCNILMTPNLGCDTRTAIHLLLDNDTQAEMCYDEMDANQQAFFDSLPISIFRNKN